jgi:hypothetical protein
MEHFVIQHPLTVTSTCVLHASPMIIACRTVGYKFVSENTGNDTTLWRHELWSGGSRPYCFHPQNMNFASYGALNIGSLAVQFHVAHPAQSLLAFKQSDVPLNGQVKWTVSDLQPYTDFIFCSELFSQHGSLAPFCKHFDMIHRTIPWPTLVLDRKWLR